MTQLDDRVAVASPHKRRASPISDVKFRRTMWQVIAAGCLLGMVAWLALNLRHNLATRNIASGFGFLDREAGLPIAEHLISYSPTDSYLHALVVGVLNTLWVSFWGIIFATIVGTAIGVARLSKNWLLAKTASAYVECFRDVPLLLQLFLWYTILQKLPSVRNPLHPIGGVFLSNRGVSLPAIPWQPAYAGAALASALGLAASYVYARTTARKGLEDGRRRIIWPVVAALILVPPLLVGWLSGATVSVEFPEQRGFNMRGGLTVSPEFTALLVGLVVYNASYIAEIVRSGLQSVGSGQHEAARALGLHPGSTLRWIIFPQSMRVIIPPLTSQYLNLIKGSSLAVAIGYQDIVSIATTAMNQNGQAIELVAIIMAVYLTISLAISLLMNVYNARVALTER